MKEKLPGRYPDETCAHTCFDCPRCEVRTTSWGRECYCKEWASVTKAARPSCTLAEANGYFYAFDLKDKMPKELPLTHCPPWKVQDGGTGCQIRSSDDCQIVASITTPRCCWSCGRKCAQESILNVCSQIVKQVNDDGLHQFARTLKTDENQKKLDAERKAYMFNEATNILAAIYSEFGMVGWEDDVERWKYCKDMKQDRFDTLRRLIAYGEALHYWYMFTVEYHHQPEKSEMWRKKMEEQMDVVEKFIDREKHEKMIGSSLL